jgi:hypothetical protein
MKPITCLTSRPLHFCWMSNWFYCRFCNFTPTVILNAFGNGKWRIRLSQQCLLAHSMLLVKWFLVKKKTYACAGVCHVIKIKNLLQRVLFWETCIKCYGSKMTSRNLSQHCRHWNVCVCVCAWVGSEDYHTMWHNTVHIKVKVQVSLC